MNEKTIEQKIVKFIRKYRLIEPGDKLLLSLSGGGDSVFAFHFLQKYSSLFQYTFSCVHFNHSLRGEESDADENFCSELCGKYQVKLFIEKENIKSIAEKKGISIEMAGREWRYDKLESISRITKSSKIITAHHASDNAETLLFNIIKGAGVTSSAGIPVKRDNIIRPFLAVTNEEILMWLERQSIEYRIDSSNTDINIPRNYLREKVVPLVKKINNRFDEAALRYTQTMRSVDMLLSDLISGSAPRFCRFENGKMIFLIDSLKSLPDGGAAEIFRRLIFKYSGYKADYTDCEKFESALYSESGKVINFRENYFGYIERENIIFTKEKKEVFEGEYQLRPGESINVAGLKINIGKVEKKQLKPEYSEDFEIISADNTDDIFILRGWKPGDKFIPLGMNKYKNVSDFLNENKIASYKKKEHLILLNRNNIVWVVGLRIDNRYRINKNTSKIIKLWTN